MKLGLIARMDCTGLGQGQTKRLARLLNPDAVMLIDSTPFNGNEQHPEWYTQSSFRMLTNGFPSSEQVAEFCKHVDVVLSCETFYNNYFVEIAKANNTRTILIANYEFLDYHRPDYHHPLPDKLVFPSEWKMHTMDSEKVTYLPTPIFDDEFKEARDVNLKRKGQRKYLFMNGKTAVHDRNGLESLYAALELARGDFTVTVKAQNDVKKHPDPRILYDYTNPVEQGDLYRDFDALIMPRRYGGQCLPMCEALMSGLPVFMTDTDPNNKLLPKEWLIIANHTGRFMTRTMIDMYSVVPEALAVMLESGSIGRVANEKAVELSRQYDAEILRSKYMQLISDTVGPLLPSGRPVPQPIRTETYHKGW